MPKGGYRRFFDLGARRARKLSLAPGDDAFRSRQNIRARYHSSTLGRRAFLTTKRERLIARYGLVVEAGIKPIGMTRRQWQKISEILGLGG